MRPNTVILSLLLIFGPTAAPVPGRTEEPSLPAGFAPRSGALASAAAVQTDEHASVVPKDLRCEYRENPLGIDARQPRLSWIITASDPAEGSQSSRGLRQTAYQVLVPHRPICWPRIKATSGTAARSLPTRISRWNTPVSHSSLASKASGKSVFGIKTVSNPRRSEDASWTMGILDPADWKGQWITEAQANVPRLPLFRKAFSVTEPFPGLSSSSAAWAAWRCMSTERWRMTRYSNPAGRFIPKPASTVSTTSPTVSPAARTSRGHAWQRNV